MTVHYNLFPWGYEKLKKGDVVTLPVLGKATVTRVPGHSSTFTVEGDDAEGRTYIFPITIEAAYHLRIREERP